LLWQYKHNWPVISHMSELQQHQLVNVNIADFQLRQTNLISYQEVKKFADALSSPIIIVHPGCNGSLEEVIEQLMLINDNRLCIENKPQQGLNGQICRGSSPEEIQSILNGSTLKGFVLDFGHAIYAAKSYQMDPMNMINEFMKFNPVLFHLADGEKSSEKDVHHRLGEGNLDLKKLVFTIPKNASVTLETPRSSKTDLKEFVQDIAYLKDTIFL